MFEKRSGKQLIVIYAVISLVIASIMAFIHYLQGWNIYVIVITANIWFFCLFYILYLPLKVKKTREKEK
jgi:hypothetical protein